MYPSSTHLEKVREGPDGISEIPPGPSRGRPSSTQQPLNSTSRISRQSSATSDSYVSKSVSVYHQHGRQFSGSIDRSGAGGSHNPPSHIPPSSGGPPWPGMGSNNNSVASLSTMGYDPGAPPGMNSSVLDRQDSWNPAAGGGGGGYYQDMSHQPRNMHGLHNNINGGPTPPMPPAQCGGIASHPYGHSPTGSMGNSMNNIPMQPLPPAPPSHSYAPPPALPPPQGNNNVYGGYSHLGSPTGGGPHSMPPHPSLANDGNMMLLPSTSGSGQRYYQHQKTASECSSFTMDTLSPSNSPQDPIAEIRRLMQMNHILQEDVKRGRKEQQVLRDEVSHFRTKCAVAAGEKREILHSYHRDIVKLVAVVDALLSKVEEAFPLLPPPSLKPSVQNEKITHESNRFSNGVEGSHNNDQTHHLSPRMVLLSSILDGSPLMPSTQGPQTANSSADQNNEIRTSKPPPVTEGLREIATALNVEMEHKGYGMSLLRVKGRGKINGRSSRKGVEKPYEMDTEQILLEEELRGIAVETHRSLESYLHALNYGFSSGAGSTNPLAVQIPAPVLHSVLSRPGGNVDSKE